MENHGMNRMQELLSSYYGLQDQEGRQEQLRDIDSPGFDSSVYVKELLKTRGLNDLLSTDDQLICEIKELDTSMQMLVYENYNKFISATDTIRKMKNNVASMEDKVACVVKSMDVITAKSESINVALAPHRSKVEKLIGVRRLLKRFEFIFDLPQRLNAAVKQKEYADATKYYLLACRILGRYEHISSFKAIQLEAEKIIQQLVRVLKKRMLDSSLESEELCDTVILLLQLDSSSDKIRDQFLEWHQEYFERTIAAFKVLCRTLETATSVLEFLQRFNAALLIKMSQVFSVYKAHFMPEVVAREKLSTSRRSSNAVRDDLFLSFVKEMFALYVSECTLQFRRPHTDFGTKEEVFDVLKDDNVSSEIVENDYYVFMRVMKHFVVQVNEVDSTIPMCGLAAHATQIVESSVRFQIEGVFRELRKDTGELLVTCHEEVCSLGRNTRDGGQSVRPLAQQFARTFTDMMQKVLRQLVPMMETGFVILTELSRLFSNLVQSQFYNFLTWFNVSVLQYAEPKRAFTRAGGPIGSNADDDDIPWLEATPPFLLFLACMCQELSAEGIGECVRSLIECLPAPPSPSSKESMEYHRMNQQDVTHMIEVTRESSFQLLQHVAKHYGNQLSVLVSNGVAATSWGDMAEEPRSVQEMMVAIVEATFRYGKEVALALDDTQSVFISSNKRITSRDFRRRTSALRSRNAAVTTAPSGMQLDVNRLFARKIHIFPLQLELTTDTFVQTMLKICIKAFSEFVRLLELSKFGLQQIQLNAEFLRSTLLYIVADGEAEEEVESLLSDLLSTARERAVEDVLMDQSNVVAIVSTKSTQALSRRG